MKLEHIALAGLTILTVHTLASRYFDESNVRVEAYHTRREIIHLEKKMDLYEKIDREIGFVNRERYIDSLSLWKSRLDSLLHASDSLDVELDKSFSRLLIYGYFTD